MASVSYSPGIATEPCGRTSRARRLRHMLCDGLESAWRSGRLSRPSLDPEALLAKAGARQRDADAGRSWRKRLDLLVGALHREAALTPLGLTIAHGQLVAALANRFRAEALWRRHPEILSISIPAPILIIGHMRSGSTRVHRLLACHPAVTATRFYESWNPVPRLPLLGSFADRYARAAFALGIAGLLNPAFRAIHPTGAFAVDEEIGLQNLSVFGAAFEAQWNVPSFVAHIETMNTEPVYAEFRRLLQTLAWLRPAHRDRRWVLKVPQFSQDLPSLLRAFPDASVVRLHRDPAEIVGSSASLVRGMMEVQSDAVDPVAVGREWVRKVGLREARMAQVPGTGPDIVNVDYEDMERDWRGESARLCRALKLEWNPAVERRVGRLIGGRTSARSSGHNYSLAEFGLTADAVRRAVSAGASGR